MSESTIIVKVRRSYNPSHYIRLYPICSLNTRCASIGRNCMLLFVFPLSDESSWCMRIILMSCFEPQYLCYVNSVALRLILSVWLMMQCLEDIMSNILIWVTIYDPFASNPGIDDNWNQLDYPWIFIVPLPFFLYVESLLCKLKYSIISYTDCIHIVNQQTRTPESEVMHTTLPNRPLSLLQNPKTTDYHEIRCTSDWYTAFGD